MTLRKMGHQIDETSEVETQIKRQTDEQWAFIEKMKGLNVKTLKSFLIINGYSGKLCGPDEYVSLNKHRCSSTERKYKIDVLEAESG